MIPAGMPNALCRPPGKTRIGGAVLTSWQQESGPFMRYHHILSGVAVAALCFAGISAAAQAVPATDTSTTTAQQNNGGVVKSPPVADREEADRLKNTREELKGVYKKWLDEDVRWIITPEEERAFKGGKVTALRLQPPMRI